MCTGDWKIAILAYFVKRIKQNKNKKKNSLNTRVENQHGTIPHTLDNFLQNPNPARIVSLHRERIARSAKYIRKSFFSTRFGELYFVSFTNHGRFQNKLGRDATSMGKGGIVRTRTIDRGRKRARKREELQHKQNVWPRANIYWLNRTHVRCALTKRYLRSYGNLTIDSSKSLNNTPFHCSHCCTTSGSSNDTFDRRK